MLNNETKKKYELKKKGKQTNSSKPSNLSWYQKLATLKILDQGLIRSSILNQFNVKRWNRKKKLSI
jgi:hypothetical protein